MKKKNILDKKWFKGKSIVVFGIGELGGGISSIKFLVANGAHVLATDIKSRETLKKSIKEIKNLKNVTLVLGQHRRENFIHADMIIKTPSCPWTNEYIKLALKNNIPVETDASLFFRLCKNKIIGITGAKGKTTVSHMVTHFLKNTGYHTIQVGVGVTPVLDRLELLKKNSIVVFELSSWRLSALKFTKISPTVSIITNFFPDHMNYYKDMDSYWSDKMQIIKYQKKDDIFIYNADDNGILDKIKNLELKMKTISVSMNNDENSKIFIRNGSVFVNNDKKIKEIAKLSNMKVIGEHNKRNMLLAMSAVFFMGGNASKIRKSVEFFSPIKYRLEHIKTYNGIKYYNDTTATNPNAAILALDVFKDKNIILLVGGSDKKLDTKDFANKIVSRVKKVFFFKGKYSEKLMFEIKKIEIDKEITNYKLYDSMKEIVKDATKSAQSDDIILLSPGASSFSLYKNEFERGDEFTMEVNNIKL